MSTFEERQQERLQEIHNRKRHYPSKKQATKTAAQLRKKFGNAVFAYKCPICDDWLLTTMPQSQSDITRAARRQRAPIAPPHPKGSP